jgi:hypothetical protein
MILEALYRRYPLALTVAAMSNLAACSRDQTRVVLDRLLRAHLITQRRSHDGIVLYLAAQPALSTREGKALLEQVLLQ